MARSNKREIREDKSRPVSRREFLRREKRGNRNNKTQFSDGGSHGAKKIVLLGMWAFIIFILFLLIKSL